MTTYDDYYKGGYPDPYATPEPEPYHPEETALPEPVDAPPPPERTHFDTPDEAWEHAEQLAQDKLDEPQVQAAIATVQAETGRDKAMRYLEQQVQVSKDASTVRPR